MISVKEEVLQAVSDLPDNAEIDDVMYRLYVIDKVRRGQDAYLRGDVISSAMLREEMRKW